MSKQSSEQVKKVRNPKGIGGFSDHPEHINAGGRPKNVQRYDYWLQYFKNLSVEEFKNYANAEKPEESMYVAEAQAYRRIYESLKNTMTWRLVADRTEGKPTQRIEAEISSPQPILGGSVKNGLPANGSHKKAPPAKK